MAEAKKIEPKVSITHRKGKSSKCPTVTDVSISWDNVLVCTAEGLGGKYEAKDVLKGLKNKNDQKRYIVKDQEKFNWLCNM